MRRLEIGIDGNCIYVGLGDLPVKDSEFVFVEIDNSENAPDMRRQMDSAYEKWCETFPDKGRLPFDVVW